MSGIERWLPGVLPRIFDDPEVQEELGRRLEAIDARIRWEAGPRGEADAFLAFSPNRYPELLPVTENLAAAMPHVAGWQFLVAKPRKQWSARKVRWSGVEYLLDDWRYRLVMFKGGEFFDVDLFTFDDSLDESLRSRLGMFLVLSELGERLFMQAVDGVNVSTRPLAGESSIEIGSLHEQLTGLLRG